MEEKAVVKVDQELELLVSAEKIAVERFTYMKRLQLESRLSVR